MTPQRSCAIPSRSPVDVRTFKGLLYFIFIFNGLYTFVLPTAAVPGIFYLVRSLSHASAAMFCAGPQFIAVKIDFQGTKLHTVQLRTYKLGTMLVRVCSTNLAR